MCYLLFRAIMYLVDLGLDYRYGETGISCGFLYKRLLFLAHTDSAATRAFSFIYVVVPFIDMAETVFFLIHSPFSQKRWRKSSCPPKHSLVQEGTGC